MTSPEALAPLTKAYYFQRAVCGVAHIQCDDRCQCSSSVEQAFRQYSCISNDHLNSQSFTKRPCHTKYNSCH